MENYITLSFLRLFNLKGSRTQLLLLLENYLFFLNKMYLLNLCILAGNILLPAWGNFKGM
jgi:hypothetical protein